MTMRTSIGFKVLGAVAVAALAPLVTLTAQSAGQNAKPSAPFVATSALEPLLPTVDGWTKGPARADRVAISDTTGYAFAEAVYTNGDKKVRVTIADTASGGDSLISLATMVATLPDDYTGDVPPASKVARVQFKGSPAASLWDSAKAEGEFTVVVGGRFVAKAEGSHLDSLDTLRAFVDRIDLKRLGDLK